MIFVFQRGWEREFEGRGIVESCWRTSNQEDEEMAHFAPTNTSGVFQGLNVWLQFLLPLEGASAFFLGHIDKKKYLLLDCIFKSNSKSSQT